MTQVPLRDSNSVNLGWELNTHIYSNMLHIYYIQSIGRGGVGEGYIAPRWFEKNI